MNSFHRAKLSTKIIIWALWSICVKPFVFVWFGFVQLGLFSKINRLIQEPAFDTIEEIKTKLKKILKALPKKYYYDCFKY